MTLALVTNEQIRADRKAVKDLIAALAKVDAQPKNMEGTTAN
jgi:hypothetical protein